MKREKAMRRDDSWKGRAARGALAVGFLTLVGLPPVACSGEGHKPVTPTIARLTKSLCDLAFKCCRRGEVSFFLGPYVDRDNCESRLTEATRLAPSTVFQLDPLEGLAVQVPNIGALDRAVRDGRTKIDSAALEKCVEYLTDTACNAPPKEEDPAKKPQCEPPRSGPEETPCDLDKIFVGNLGLGDECTSGTGGLSCQDVGDEQVCTKTVGTIECAPGLVCAKGTGLGVNGQCALPKYEGAECFSDVECAENLYCSQLDGTCQRLRKEGEVCVFTDRDKPVPNPGTLVIRCEPGLSCDPVTDTCVAPCQRGAVCSTDLECDDEQELSCIVSRCDKPRAEGLPCAESDDCVQGLLCGDDPENPGKSICQKRLEIGEPCLTHPECDSDFCDPTTGLCAAPVPPGSACPSGDDAECDGGACNSDFVSCVDDMDCPSGRSCDVLQNRCESICVALKPDGATCTGGTECESTACIAGFCRTLPLNNGDECVTNVQCESGFCGLEDKRVCTDLPLPNGAACSSSDQCESLVCFNTGTGSQCTTGLEEGDPCGDIGQEPCDPKRFFCDMDEDPSVCAPLREAGEDCDSAVQCRGDCILKFGRMMCSAAAPPEGAVCDGD